MIAVLGVVLCYAAVLVVVGVAGADRQAAAFGHRVARVDREVEDGVLELVGIGVGAPEAGGQVEVAAPPTDPVDTTGAGDAVMAGLLFRVLRRPSGSGTGPRGKG